MGGGGGREDAIIWFCTLIVHLSGWFLNRRLHQLAGAVIARDGCAL